MFLWYFVPSNTVAGLNARRFAHGRTGLRAAFPVTRLVGRLARGAVRVVLTWRVRRRTIAELAVLDDHALQDIGLHRSDIPRVARETADTYVAKRMGLTWRLQ
jgi:uncharacterized protein YjiS (DUF1127 family)